MKGEKIVLAWDINKETGEFAVLLCLQKSNGGTEVLQDVNKQSKSEGQFVIGIPELRER